VLNDAVAIALFSTLQLHLNEENPRLFSAAVLGHFFLISVFSLILGLVAGAFLSMVFRRARYLARFPETELVTMCLGAYLTFALAQLLGLSGIVALFFYGAVLSQYNWYNLSEQSKVATHVTFGMLAKLAESCVCLILGAVAALSLGRFHWHFGLVVYTSIVVVVARGAHIFPLTYLINLWRERDGVKLIGKNMSIVMWISGLRGAIAFALSLRLPCSTSILIHRGQPDCKNSDLLVTTTISIVMLTTLVVGTAMEKLMTFFGVIEATENDSPSRSRSASEIMAAASGNSASALSVPLACHELASQASTETPYSSLGDLSGTSTPTLQQQEGRGGSQSLWTLRFNARGHLSQAFARFDLSVLQPALGGPCRLAQRSPSGLQSVELPSLQGSFVPATPLGSTPHAPSPVVESLPLQSPLPPEVEEDEEPPPDWSRAVVFS